MSGAKGSPRHTHDFPKLICGKGRIEEELLMAVMIFWEITL